MTIVGLLACICLFFAFTDTTVATLKQTADVRLSAEHSVVHLGGHSIGIPRVIDADAAGVLMGSTPTLVRFTAASQARRASAFEGRRRVKQ